MIEPNWLEIEQVEIVQEQIINMTGGMNGIREKNLLESALFRPKNLYIYEININIYELAACYAEAVSHNHPFIDGNKRTAFACSSMFLEDNNLTLSTENQEEIENIIVDLTEKKITLKEFAIFLQKNSK